MADEELVDLTGSPTPEPAAGKSQVLPFYPSPALL